MASNSLKIAWLSREFNIYLDRYVRAVLDICEIFRQIEKLLENVCT
jgi:hypothetical protein